MAIIPNYAIIRFSIPLLGEWMVDESYNVFHNEKKISDAKSIPECQKIIRQMVENMRQAEIQKRQAEIRDLQALSANLNNYRVKF